MAAYATVEDIQARMIRDLSDDEKAVCEALLLDAGVMIDAYNTDAPEESKKIVSCRMVSRAIGDGADGGVSVPVGATQGNISALGYAQSWTMGNGGGAGELYLGKMEKKLLGYGNKVGSYSPVQELVTEVMDD